MSNEQTERKKWPSFFLYFSPGRFLITFAIWCVGYPLGHLIVGETDRHFWAKTLFVATFTGIIMGFYEGTRRRKAARNLQEPTQI